MGIKRKRHETYIADTGQEFELEDMTVSHILNVIAHHIKQRRVLLSCPGELRNSNIDDRTARMDETINTLYGELASRDTDEES